MVRVKDFCVDRYEAPNRKGAQPLAMQSANDADAWCAAHHKRLCTEDEWISACEGDEHRAYPYGSEHVDERCNDDKPWIEVDEATLAKWPAPEAQRAREGPLPGRAQRLEAQVRLAGRRLRPDRATWRSGWCGRASTRTTSRTSSSVATGPGCYGGGKPTCHSTNNAHGPEFRFYETGFRCCKDASKKDGAAPPAPR